MKNKATTNYISNFRFIADKISVNKKSANRYFQKSIFRLLKAPLLPFLKNRQLFFIEKCFLKKQAISNFFFLHAHRYSIPFL